MLKSDSIKARLAELRVTAEELINKDGVTAEEIDTIRNDISMEEKKLAVQEDIENAERGELEGTPVAPVNVMGEPKAPVNVLFEQAKNLQNFILGKEHSLEDAKNSLGTGTGSSGGVAVETELSKEIIRSLKDRAEAYSFFDGRVGKGNWDILIVSSETAAEWVAEGQSPAGTTDPTTAKTTLTQNRLFKEIEVTQQLINASSEEFIATIVDIVADALLDTLEAAIFNGTGTNQPTGLCTGLGAGRKVTAATIGGIDLADLKKVKHKLKRRYRSMAAWFMTDETFLEIDLLEDANGRPLFQPNPTGATEYVLLGRPVMITDGLDLPDAASKSIVVFASPKAYETNTQKSIAMDVYNDSSYKKRGMVGLASDVYVDGKRKDDSKVAVLVNPAV